jgi:hypothetical protein
VNAKLLVTIALTVGLTPLGAVGQQPQKPTSSAKEGEAIAYTPPLRGAPQRRIGGASRGNESLPAVFVLAPDHVGLTTSEAPALYWYVSGATKVKIELTLIDEKQTQPLVETPVQPAAGPGFHSLRLADTPVKLKPDVEYQWTVSLVPDDKERSNDVISGGVIKRVARPASLGAGEHGPAALAAAGLWYDAIAALSQQIEARPNDAVLREQRASLLDQVGLKEAAAYDRGQK